MLNGLLIAATFLMQDSLVVRAGEVALLILLHRIVVGRVKVLPIAAILLGVTGVHLLAPHGKVLLEPLGLPVTEGALKLGLFKGLFLIGLIYISRCFVSSRINMPGRIGTLLGLTLSYFEELTSYRGKLTRKNIWGQVDSLLLSVWESRTHTTTKEGVCNRTFTPIWLIPPAIVLFQGIFLVV